MDRLSEKRLIIRLEETESTNSYLKQLLREKHLEEGSIVVADYQTGGRGQRGNSWISAKGKNLLFSLLIYPKNVFAKDQFIISRIASLAKKTHWIGSHTIFALNGPTICIGKIKKLPVFSSKMI